MFRETLCSLQVPTGSREADYRRGPDSTFLKLVSCSKSSCGEAFITLGLKGNIADFLPKANVNLYEYLSLLPQRDIILDHCFKWKPIFLSVNAMNETKKHLTAGFFSIQCKYLLPSYRFVSQILV